MGVGWEWLGLGLVGMVAVCFCGGHGLGLCFSGRCIEHVSMLNE